ncbi:MarR family transcriptional regulator [Amycolatopsis lurida]
MNRSRVANLLGAGALAVAERVSGEAARAAGVSASGAAALSTLLVEPGIGVTELGARIGLSQPATARMLDTLIAAGLVERHHPGGRGVRLTLTETGRANAEKLLEARGRVLLELLEPLTDDQVSALAPALEALLAGLVENRRSEYVLCRLCDRQVCARCPVGEECRSYG